MFTHYQQHVTISSYSAQTINVLNRRNTLKAQQNNIKIESSHLIKQIKKQKKKHDDYISNKMRMIQINDLNRKLLGDIQTSYKQIKNFKRRLIKIQAQNQTYKNQNIKYRKAYDVLYRKYHTMKDKMREYEIPTGDEENQNQKKLQLLESKLFDKTPSDFQTIIQNKNIQIANMDTQIGKKNIQIDNIKEYNKKLNEKIQELNTKLKQRKNQQQPQFLLCESVNGIDRTSSKINTSQKENFFKFRTSFSYCEGDFNKEKILQLQNQKMSSQLKELKQKYSSLQTQHQKIKKLFKS